MRDTVMKRLNRLVLSCNKPMLTAQKCLAGYVGNRGADVAKFFHPHTGFYYPFDSIRIAGKKTKLFVKN